ncbi:PAS domain-containing hybrid sensor histidine kinase/response regulator [Maridesulfovibrio bastinii]|uniref:PAS domain-containing hybrid sensor histidine kinase/response regulator n=1 Tax=Maridesulfovibrio bastinii TaxID=47157 RepID=UPI0004260F80|nr:PAS domain-containing hybrid sensor histidine kinase/response regulator [Maridesulfovibrio bastinii]
MGNSNKVYPVFDRKDISEKHRPAECCQEKDGVVGRDFYDSFFRKNHIVTIIFDPENGVILDANDAACSFYGYSISEIKKIKVYDLNTVDSATVDENIDKAVRRSQNEFLLEHRLADGRTRNVRVYSGVAPVFGRECIYSCIFDVTEHVTTQKKLADSEEKFKKLYLEAPVPYQSLDADGTFVDVNNTFCKILGYEKKDLIGRNFSEIIHPEWRINFQQNFPKFKSIGEILGVEFKLLRKDGTYLLVSFSGRIDRNDDGSFKQTHCVFRDITRERENMLGLMENEHRFRSLFEGLEMIAVQGYDADRKIIFWNKTSERLFGYSADEVLGRPIEELVLPEKSRQRFVKGLKAWIDGGSPLQPGESVLVDKKGNQVPVYFSHVMQLNKSGNVEIYSINVDLTEIKKANLALLKAKEEAERANQAKSIFLANMSHELRTPLNGIIGMHGLLQTTGLDGEQERYINGAVTAARRLTDLLGDVLDLSKIEAGKTFLVEAPFNLRELLRNTGELFTPSCLQKGLEQTFYFDERLPEIVIGDQIRIMQVITNLLGNSIKFTDSGFIRFEVHLIRQTEADLTILFIVSDSGIGIADDELDNISEIFMQGEDSYVRRFQGAGLGLSIVKKLVEMMNGSLSIDSVKGKGTDIYFSVPLKTGSENSLQNMEYSEKLLEEKSRPSKILLVEDEAINRLAMKRMLEKYGTHVSCAVNGLEALDQLKNDSFDVVLMDIQMPVMDGIKATLKIRSGKAGDTNKEIPIIALTAYAMAGDREEFLGAGMNDCLTKPIDMDKLIKVLNL